MVEINRAKLISYVKVDFSTEAEMDLYINMFEKEGENFYNELKKVGIIVSENDDGMTLKKGDIRSDVELDSHGDHRLFMAFSILAMSIGDCVVTDPDSASVSYPNFVSDMQNCGGRMSIV